MKAIKPSIQLLSTENTGDEMLRIIERAGRVCYKSEDRITSESAAKFVKALIARGHEAVLEHGVISMKIICDRGVSHEIVRHRMASYCQESTRYCNYSHAAFQGEITCITPCFLVEGTYPYKTWARAMQKAEDAYFDMLNLGCSPQEARSVLPNSLKTEIIMTANVREWRHFLKLRCSTKAHPQMREVAKLVREVLQDNYPVLFDDIEVD